MVRQKRITFWSSAVAIAAIGFIIWSLHIIFTVNLRRDEIARDATLIGLLQQVQSEVREMDAAVLLLVPNQTTNNTDLSLADLESSYTKSRDQLLELYHAETDIADVVSRIDNHMKLLKQTVQKTPTTLPSADEVLTTLQYFQWHQYESQVLIDQTVQSIRFRMSNTSVHLSDMWHMLNVLVIISCAMALAFAGSVYLHQKITARRVAAERAYAASEKRFEILTNTVPAGIFIIRENRFLFSNPAGEEITRYDRDQLKSISVTDIFPLECGQCTEMSLADEGMIEMQPTHKEIEINAKDGTRRWLDLAILPVFYEPDPACLLTVFDITQIKDIQKSLQEAIASAEEANQVKSRFLANMSHEIRNPLNAMFGMIDLTLDTPLTPEQRDYLNVIKESAGSLLSLLNSLLDLSKLEAGRLTMEQSPFDLRLLVEGTVETMAIQAQRKQLELLCHIKPDVPTALTGDPVRLRQIIINLVGNAIKFTNEGEILIRIECAPCPEPDDTMPICLRFTVSDTGIGIPEQKQKQVFESFVQAEEAHSYKFGGAGLGLSIVKQLVELMQGEIRVKSEVNQGSTFHFTARFAPGLSSEPESMFPEATFSRTGPVLIVDSNANNRLILKEMLTNWGFSITEAANEEAALSACENAVEEGNHFSIGLLDHQLPTGDGVQLAQSIHDHPGLESTAIILMTSTRSASLEENWSELGFSGMIRKPIRQSELLNMVLDALGGRSLLNLDGAGTTENTIPPLIILVAEDNAVNRIMVIRILEKMGHQVNSVKTGRDVLTAIRDKEYDLVLMDLQMPDMDGLEATRVLRNSQSSYYQPDLPVVAVTAQAMRGDRERCLAAGMNDYLSKPLRKNDLVEVIKRLGAV